MTEEAGEKGTNSYVIYSYFSIFRRSMPSAYYISCALEDKAPLVKIYFGTEIQWAGDAFYRERWQDQAKGRETISLVVGL